MDPLLYQYGLGGLVFLIGMVFAARQGYVGLSGAPLRNLVIVLGGLLLLAAIQGYLQYAPMAETTARAYRGGFERRETLGTPLDYGVMIGYFAIILGIGTWFARRRKTLKDFFFAGQRFSWWLITFSLIATTVGSYSFVKYSRVAFDFGTASSQTYLNDWFWVPLLVFGWLPILYFSRITSIPEYFERRFDRRVRAAVTVLVLVYLVSYVGVNLFTMGKVLNILLGWHVLTAAGIVAAISAVYVTAGGQTSVVMTDLFQGLMLLATGIVILVLGATYVGGLDELWNLLPRGHRTAFDNFNRDPSFPSVGITWQDGIANTAMFYFLNQGMVMRFMSARSVQDGRKAMFAVALILMPIAACVVASGGWVAKALGQAGVLPADIKASEAFFIASEFLSTPGVFGLILAALTAALMSTVDTLITAVAAVVVNDVYKPHVRPHATDRELLRVARGTSIAVTLVGIALVPVFMQFATIYEAHGAMTAAVTPPLVVALLLSVFWRRFTAAAALATVVGGIAAVVVSLFVPEVIAPFAHGVPAGDAGDGLFGGMKQYKFMRACYGVCVSLAIGVVVTLFTKPQPRERQRGLVWGTVRDAIEHYKGAPGSESDPRKATAAPRTLAAEPEPQGDARLPVVRLSTSLAQQLVAEIGDLVYVTDRRWWTGGIHSAHAIVGAIDDGPADAATVAMGPDTFAAVVTRKRAAEPVVVHRLY